MGKGRQRGFTLVELIAVLTIMAIVLSIAIPAVTNLMKAGAVNSASREVSNTLSLARQMAITHRTNARVVFPYSNTGIQPDMWYHTYAVMTNSDTTNPAGWRYVTKWEYLPTGAVFLNGNPPGPGSLNDPNSLPNPQSLPFPDATSGNNGTLAYIEFGPTGAASQKGTLAIGSGFIANSLPQVAPPYNFVTNVVDNIVGRIQVIHP